jgi:Mycothiol maleylpyruvate isomerase N-terminal domain
MRELSFPHLEAVDVLRDQVGEFEAAVSTLDEMQLLAPSLCHGWSVLDLVVHVRMGLQELAIGTTSRTEEATDHDAASYWGTHPDGRDDDPVPHILWLRRVASAYRRPSGAVAHLKDGAASAMTAVQSMPEGVVEFKESACTAATSWRPGWSSWPFISSIWVTMHRDHAVSHGPG